MDSMFSPPRFYRSVISKVSQYRAAHDNLRLSIRDFEEGNTRKSTGQLQKFIRHAEESLESLESLKRRTARRGHLSGNEDKIETYMRDAMHLAIAISEMGDRSPEHVRPLYRQLKLLSLKIDPELAEKRKSIGLSKNSLAEGDMRSATKHAEDVFGYLSEFTFRHPDDKAIAERLDAARSTAQEIYNTLKGSRPVSGSTLPYERLLAEYDAFAESLINTPVGFFILS